MQLFADPNTDAATQCLTKSDPNSNSNCNCNCNCHRNGNTVPNSAKFYWSSHNHRDSRNHRTD